LCQSHMGKTEITRAGILRKRCDGDAWEIDAHGVTPEWFSKHTVTELLTDYQPEAQGRLAHPMRWTTASDNYYFLNGKMLSAI
jgi:hypothetical protein